jgi:hypothetical protein
VRFEATLSLNDHEAVRPVSGCHGTLPVAPSAPRHPHSAATHNPRALPRLKSARRADRTTTRDPPNLNVGVDR